MIDLPEYKIPPEAESSFFVNTNKSKRAIRIDSTKPFEVQLDLAPFVKKFGADILCSKCDEVLVRIEPGGILGEKLNELDVMVIRDHILAKHNDAPEA